MQGVEGSNPFAPTNLLGTLRLNHSNAKVIVPPGLSQETLFHRLVDGITDYAIFLLDANGYIVSWNEGARRLKGYEPEEVLGRHLPLNGAGVCGAVLADIDFPLGVTRGAALLARCAGLLGQLAEELSDPIAIDMYMNIDRNTDYQPLDARRPRPAT